MQERDGSRVPLLPTAHQKARELSIMQRGVPGVGLGEGRVITKSLGREPPHHFGFAVFENWEDFFVLISLLSCLLCNSNKIL